MNDQFLFVLAPYAATIALPTIVLMRYLLWVRQGADLRAQWLETHQLFGGGRAWRIGLLALFAAHLGGLLLPQQLLVWNRVAPRLMLLEGTAWAFGLAALVGSLRLAYRHVFGGPNTRAASVVDSAFMAVVLVQILSGLSMALMYRWASSWSAVTLTPYLASALRLQPRLELIASMPYLVKLHVFSAVVAIGLLPWTHLAHFAVYPLDRALRSVSAPAVRLLNLAWARVDGWSQRTVAATSIWPEQGD